MIFTAIFLLRARYEENNSFVEPSFVLEKEKKSQFFAVIEELTALMSWQTLEKYEKIALPQQYILIMPHLFALRFAQQVHFA